MKILSAVLGLCFLCIGGYIVFTPANFALKPSEPTPHTVALYVKETVPCHLIARGVPRQEAIENSYRSPLTITVTHDPTSYTEKEGVVM